MSFEKNAIQKVVVPVFLETFPFKQSFECDKRKLTNSIYTGAGNLAISRSCET